MKVRDMFEQRRLQMALMVEEGHTVEEVARHFESNDTTVRRACDEHGIMPNRGRGLSIYKVMALLLNTNLPYSDIAHRLGTKPHYVSCVAGQAHEAGIVFKHRDRSTVVSCPLGGSQDKTRQPRGFEAPDMSLIPADPPKPPGPDEGYLVDETRGAA